MIKCEICKGPLPEVSNKSYCDRFSCTEIVTQRLALNERIEIFSDFFKDKVPNEENYKSYLELAGLEKTYQEVSYKGLEQPPKFSRRTWFTANIRYCHISWPDEFGKKQNEMNG